MRWLLTGHSTLAPLSASPRFINSKSVHRLCKVGSNYRVLPLALTHLRCQPNRLRRSSGKVSPCEQLIHVNCPHSCSWSWQTHAQLWMLSKTLEPCTFSDIVGRGRRIITNGCTSLWNTLQNTGLFSHGVYTPSAEKCDVEHVCFHSVRLLRDPSFGYPEHSNWQRGFWQCSNFTSFTHPTKQTNKQTESSR
jgi:hypothetical protein